MARKPGKPSGGRATQKPATPGETPASRCPFKRGDRFRERITGYEGAIVDAVSEYGVTIRLDQWEGMARPPYGGAMPYCVGLLEPITATITGA